MMKKQIVSMIIAILLNSCINKTSEHNKKETLHLDIPAAEVQKTVMSDIISEFKAIKLEFTEQSMIGSIKKIVMYDGLIYILDPFGSKTLLVFNSDGKFIRRIGSIGKGPGQLLMPQDFIIDSIKNEIEILGLRQIQIFNTKGEFLRNFSIGFTALDFIKISNKYYFAVVGKEDYKVIQTDINGKVERNYLPTLGNYIEGNACMPFMALDSENLLYKSILCDTIFSLNPRISSPSIVLDFGKYKCDYNALKYISKAERMNLLVYKNNTNKCLISRYLENSNHCLVSELIGQIFLIEKDQILIPMEKYNIPYLFISTTDGCTNSVFIPEKNEIKFSKQYYSTIKKIL